MKAPSLIIILFLLCMTIVFVALGLISVHNQRSNNQVMERVIAELKDRSTQLETELLALRQEQLRLETEARTTAAATPASGAASVTNASEAVTRPPLPQPFQARAYVGKDYLGMAWVVPNNIKTNQETGDYLFEPVIWINEKSRSTFTQTNVVEREVVRNNSYTQVYQQPYWNSYPLWYRPTYPVRPPGQHPPSAGQPKPPSYPSSPPIIGQGDRSMSMGP